MPPRKWMWVASSARTCRQKLLVAPDALRDSALQRRMVAAAAKTITSSFGQREDPVLGNGEGEFHKGLDISAPNGAPIRATGEGVVKSAQMENGYGRAVVIDHGHGVETLYGHMSGFAVMAGQTVVRGQVIGYVGHSGRVTGNHVHYEVRIRNTPVNPHKYLRTTLAELGSEAPSLPSPPSLAVNVKKAAGAQ